MFLQPPSSTIPKGEMACRDWKQPPLSARPPSFRSIRSSFTCFRTRAALALPPTSPAVCWDSGQSPKPPITSICHSSAVLAESSGVFRLRPFLTASLARSSANFYVRSTVLESFSRGCCLFLAFGVDDPGPLSFPTCPSSSVYPRRAVGSARPAGSLAYY